MWYRTAAELLPSFSPWRFSVYLLPDTESCLLEVSNGNAAEFTSSEITSSEIKTALKLRKREKRSNINAKHLNTTECTGLEMSPEETKHKGLRGRANRRQGRDHGARRQGKNGGSFSALTPSATHCGSIWAMFVVIRDPQSPPCR